MPRLKLLKKAAFYRCRCRVRVLLSPQRAAEHSLCAFNCAAVHRGAGGHFCSAAREDGGGGVEKCSSFPSRPVVNAPLTICNSSVFQDDFALRLVADFDVMRYNDNRAAGIVELSENLHDDEFVFFVEISGRLIGE